MRVKKTKNGDPKKKKNGDPKKKKDFYADYEANKKKKKSVGWDEEREPKKRGRDKQTPLLSEGAQESIKKTRMSEAEKAKEDDFRKVEKPSTGVYVNERKWPQYDSEGEGSTKKELDTKYRDKRKSEEQREKEKKERMKATEEAVLKEEKKNSFEMGRGMGERESDEEQEARAKEWAKKKEHTRQSRQDSGDTAYRLHKEKYERDLKNAKTPEEKQRIRDWWQSKETQAKDKEAKEYKLGGKVKVLKKYRNGGKTDPKKKNKLKDMLAKRKAKKAGKKAAKAIGKALAKMKK